MERQASEKKPRACFVYYAGFVQLLYREAIALKNQGFDVDVICLKYLPEEKTHQIYEGMRVFRIQSRAGAEKTTIGYLLRLVHFFNKAFLFLSYLSIRHRYAIVHFTAPPDAAIFVSLIPKLLGSKVILDIHDIGPELYMRKLGVKESHPIITVLKGLERYAARFADHVITVTDLWRDVLVSRSTHPGKCSVLLNVPDSRLFNFEEPRHSPDGEFNLYYHGSLEEHFGVDTLLDAMPLIKERIPRVKLHIYPLKRGRSFGQLTDKVEQCRMSDYVKFHDSVPFARLPEVLKNADLGIVPTKSRSFSNEAVSSKSFDYMFSGIPMVISRTAGHRFYYTEEMVMFFEPDNAQDLATAVVALFHDVELRREKIRCSREFVEFNNWDKLKLVYLNIVNRLVAGSVS